MKRKLLLLIPVILIIAGISVILIPIISMGINAHLAKHETDSFDKQSSDENIINNGSYEDAVKNNQVDTDGYLLDEDNNRISDSPVHFKADLDRLYKDSLAYNNNLITKQPELLFDMTYTEPSLDLSNYGIFDYIYGYISVPSVDIEQPIYLGANDDTMSYGVGHLTYTSLPIGGKNTNTVLAAHTGYFGKTFFDNLPNVDIGDTVYIKNYWGTLEYKIVATEIHTPTDSYRMYIEKDKDLLTLCTCIYADNGTFNRFYVICERNN